MLDITAKASSMRARCARATRPNVILLGVPALLSGHDAASWRGRPLQIGRPRIPSRPGHRVDREVPESGLPHIVIFSRRSGKALDASGRFFTALGIPERLVARLFDTEKPARATCCTACPTPTKLRHTPRHSIGPPANLRARAGTSPGHLAGSAIPWQGRCSFREGRPLWTSAYVSRRASC